MSVIEAPAPGERFELARSLARGAAPIVPGRADSPLEPTGGAYLGNGSIQLAAALQRRYGALLIKTLYAGDPDDGGTLEHAVAYDPATGVAHDARGSFSTVATAFEDFGASDIPAVCDETAPPPGADDGEADAYVERHWGPHEDGNGAGLGSLEIRQQPDGPEFDALLGGQRQRKPKVRVLDDISALLEAIWNEKLHPRWPPGAHDHEGHNIGGEFMHVGQRFDLGGHEWEIANVAGDKIIAHEASGDVAKAETRVFDTTKVADPATGEVVDHALVGASPSAPRILKSGFKPHTKTVIPDENSVVVDADRHEETHDPSIQPHPLSKLTPEQWSHFGRVDQLYYNEVMDRFGTWEVNGHKPPPISTPGSQWGKKLAAIKAGAPTDAVSTFEKEIGSLKGETEGRQLSGTRIFSGLSGSPAALASAQRKYQRFREYESDLNSLLAWDLYNRLGAPDITVIHRAKGATVFKKVLAGKASMLSGLSNSWKTGSWNEPDSFVYALPVRQAAFFESLLGQGWGSGSSESEIANIDRLKIGKSAGYYFDHEISSGYGHSQASKLFKWLGDKLNKDGQSGWVADALKKHFDKDDPYTVDLGQVDANFQLKKPAGVKTYFIPPDNVMADIEDAVSANPGHPAWDEQKQIADMPEDLKPKPGMIIEKGASQAGTRYLVIQNDALGPNEIQYVPLLKGSADYDVKPVDYNVNPGGGGYKTTKCKVVLGDDGKPLFFPLPPPPAERTWHHDMASLAPGGPAIPAGQMDVGDKIAINDDHWQITKKTGALVSLQSLSDGSEATVDSLWKTQKLTPTGEPTFKPKAGQTAALADGRIVNVLSVSDDGKTAEVNWAGTHQFETATGSLHAAPQLPKLTPQKNDTFTSDGVKYTVTNVLKNGTVAARPFIPGEGTQKVKQFPPDHPDLANLFRPGDYEPGSKAKLGTLQPGTLINHSAGQKITPYLVLGSAGGKTHLKSLDTGEIVHLSPNKSYPVLGGKGAAAAAAPHDSWKPGDKVDTADFEPGDKFEWPSGTLGTITHEEVQQGQMGWHYQTADGEEGWFPKDFSQTSGVQITYQGKLAPSEVEPKPPATDLANLPDAIMQGDFEPWKTKGSPQYPHVKANTLPVGAHFTGKDGKLWKVKQSGAKPIITDGESLYTVNGHLFVRPEPDKTLTDKTPDIAPPPSAPAPSVGEYGPVTPNQYNHSLATLKLAAGDKFTAYGHTWTVLDALPQGQVHAKADDAAIMQAFPADTVPQSVQRKKVAELPSFLTATAHKEQASSFHHNELAQRADGSLVYLKNDYASGNHWVQVGGDKVDIPAHEQLTPVTLTSNVPAGAVVAHTGNKVDVQDLQPGQTFFTLTGTPHIVLGKGPAGLDAKSLGAGGAILHALPDAHGELELGDWKPGPPVAPGSPLYSLLHSYNTGAPGTYGSWSVKKLGDGSTALYYDDNVVALQDTSGHHYVADVSGGSMGFQAVLGKIKDDWHETIPQWDLKAKTDAASATPPAGQTDANGMPLAVGDQVAWGGSKGYVYQGIHPDKPDMAYITSATDPPGTSPITVFADSVAKVKQSPAAVQPGEPQLSTLKSGPLPLPAGMVPNTKPLKDLPAGTIYAGISTHKDSYYINKLSPEGSVTPEQVPPFIWQPDGGTPSGGGSVPGPGIHPATSLVKGHHMKIKTTGGGAEYEVLETPKPGDKTIKVMTIKGQKVYDWNHHNKDILITQAPPAPGAAEMTPNTAHQSFADLGLGPGDEYTSGGFHWKVKHVQGPLLQIEADDGHTTTVATSAYPDAYIKTSPPVQSDKNGAALAPGDPVTLYGTPGFTYQGPDPDAPGHILATDPNDPDGAPLQVNTADVEKGIPQPVEPAAPPPSSAPIPVDPPKSLGELNVGDKYSFPSAQPLEHEVVAKGPAGVTIKSEDGHEQTWPPDTPFQTPPTVTYKAPPPTGANAAGQLGAPPHETEMPIKPYLWPKSGTKSYHAITDLQPGDQFSDKNGTKYTVVAHNPKKLEDATATTTVQIEGSGTIEVPQTFTNKKGKVLPTRVNKLSTTATVPQPANAPPEPLPQPQTFGDTRVGDLMKIAGMKSTFKITADHGDTVEVTSTHDGSVSDFAKDLPFDGEVIGHESPTTTAPTPGHLSSDEAKLMLDDATFGQPPAGTKGWYVTKAAGAGYYVDAPSGQGGSNLHPITYQQAHDWMVHGTVPQASETAYAADALLHGDVETHGNLHTELKGSPQHAANVLYYGTGENALPIAYSDEAGTIHVTPVKYAPEIDNALAHIKDSDPNHVVASSQTDLDDQIAQIEAPPPAEAPSGPVIEKLPVPAIGPSATIPDYTEATNGGANLTVTGGAGGTTGAQNAVDENGNGWLIKAYGGNENRVASELLANAIYRTLGHSAAQAGMIDTPEGKKLAYQKLPGVITAWSGSDPAKMKALGQGFMTDALVGNWDFAGLDDDNVLWNGDEPTRIDQGGTFLYRAQGQKKAFGPVPTDIKTMLTIGQAAKGVSVSEPEMRAQAGGIADTLTPAKIDALVDAAPFADTQMRKSVRDSLKARVKWMGEFAKGEHSDMLEGVKLAPEPSAAAAPGPSGVPGTSALTVPEVPDVEEMPIKPYLWPKSGSKSYPTVASLATGAVFTDKSGTKYRVISNGGGVTVVEPVDAPGATLAIPQSFVSKGKTLATRVNVV